MSNYTNDWSWKGGDDTFKKRSKYKHKAKKIKDKKGKKKGFYYSEEWQSLRYRVLRKYSAECMCCGRSKKKHGVCVHVDHIKPRSKYRYLELCFDNLQVLCEDCNKGKSNKDETDWRPSE